MNDKALIEKLESLPLDFWDFKEEDTKKFTHGIHSYPAIMVSPISKNIIKIVKEIMNIETLYDPFMGSGSVLIESILNGVKHTYGTDLNPLALLLSKVRTTPLKMSQIVWIKNVYIDIINFAFEKYKDLPFQLHQYIVNEKQLDITDKKGWGENADIYLEEFKAKYNIDIEFPKFKNIGFWFKPQVIFELKIIKDTITTIEDENIKNFLLITFSEIVRKVSNTRNGEFKLYRIAKEKLLNYNYNTKQEYIDLLQKNIDKMISFVDECNGLGDFSVDIKKCSCAKLDNFEELLDDSLDLVITSPPYGDSRTTVAYGQYSRLSLQWIDCDCDEAQNIDRSLLGGVVSKRYDNSLDSETLNKLIKEIEIVDKKRALEVLAFYYDLDKCIESIAKKMKKNSYQFWVVGNRTVKNVYLNTDLIIAEMAKKYELNHIYTFNRNIVNKVMPSVNSPTNEKGKTISTMMNEYIVVLKKE